MHLPHLPRSRSRSHFHSRPWLMELADQPFCPPVLREGVQTILTYMWTHRIPPFQWRAPYVLPSEVLERIVDEIYAEDALVEARGQEGEGEDGRDGGGELKVVDLCSGAGGPVGVIERRINSNRQHRSLPPLKFVLSDLHPPTTAWDELVTLSPTGSLVYIPASVDATHARLSRSITSVSPKGALLEGCGGEVYGGRHLRTFFLSFHHFNDESARGVLVDAMRDAEGICIFELQEPTLGSLFTILMLFPLTLLLTPFQRPSLTTLFFTYVIPLLPLLLVFDGLISAYRTRSPQHILHLANLASLSLHLEGGDKEEDVDWKWEWGRGRHTWPWGNCLWMVGRRDRKFGVAEFDEEGEPDEQREPSEASEVIQ